MKAIIAWPISWFMFGVGDLMCRLCNVWGCALFANAYQFFMRRSLDIQVWGGDYGPWRKPEE